MIGQLNERSLLVVRVVCLVFQWWHSFLQRALQLTQSRQLLHSFLLFSHFTRSLCTTLENPITSDNLTKSSAFIYEILMTFIFPSLTVAMSRNECDRQDQSHCLCLFVFHFDKQQPLKSLKGRSKVRTCRLLCQRQGCSHSANKTHVRDRIFKLSPIHASVIYQIPRNR